MRFFSPLESVAGVLAWLGMDQDAASECAARIGDRPISVGDNIWQEDGYGRLLAVAPHRILTGAPWRWTPGRDVALIRAKVDANAKHVVARAGQRVIARFAPKHPAHPHSGICRLHWLLPPGHPMSAPWTRAIESQVGRMFPGRPGTDPWRVLCNHCATAANRDALRNGNVHFELIDPSRAASRHSAALSSRGVRSFTDRRRQPEGPPEIDPIKLFRGWMAGRILDPFGENSAGPREPDALSDSGFPHEAWAVFSKLAAAGSDPLASELRRVFRLVFHDLFQLAFRLPTLRGSKGNLPAGAEAFFEGLDAVLPMELMRVQSLVEARAVISANSGIVLDAAFANVGRPLWAEAFMHRYFQLAPEEEAAETEHDGLIMAMIECACEAVEALERLQGMYPGAAARVARYRNSWPVIRRRAQRADGVFERLADSISLGRDYPLEPGAKVHDARQHSLRQYLTPLVEWLTTVCSRLADEPGENQDAMAACILRRRGNPWGLPVARCAAGLVGLLVKGAALPKLDKRSAPRWAREVVTPFIMLTDAAQFPEFTEPALAAVWRQRKVKTARSFQSQLLGEVRRNLVKMARD